VTSRRHHGGVPAERVGIPLGIPTKYPLKEQASSRAARGKVVHLRPFTPWVQELVTGQLKPLITGLIGGCAAQYVDRIHPAGQISSPRRHCLHGHRTRGPASPRQPQPRQRASRQSSGVPACPHTMLSALRGCVFLNLRLSHDSSSPLSFPLLSHPSPPPSPAPALRHLPVLAFKAHCTAQQSCQPPPRNAPQANQAA